MKKNLNNKINKICVLIPARYSSKRLPGKPLIKIRGKEILLLTYDRVKKFFNNHDIFVLASDKLIYEKLKKKIKNIIITKGKFNNGTERASASLSKISKKYKAALIISCDNPYFSLESIRKIIATYKKIENNNEYFGSTVHKINKVKNPYIKNNPNIAKIAFNQKNDVLYISRSFIPHIKKKNSFFFTHHGPVCIKINYLKKYLNMKNTFFQKLEDNEWLKFIEHGFKLKTIGIRNIPREINTLDDLNYYKKK